MKLTRWIKQAKNQLVNIRGLVDNLPSAWTDNIGVSRSI